MYKRAKDQLSKTFVLDCETYPNHLTGFWIQPYWGLFVELRINYWFSSPWAVFFLNLLRALSDTLPTAVKLHCWHIQSDAKCTLCNLKWPTTAHILGNCLVVLTQQRYTYQHNQFLHMLAIKLKALLSGCEDLNVYASLQGLHSNESPQETIPLSILVTYQTDIVIYNRILHNRNHKT